MSFGSPAPQGLYDGLHEHDACGVAFVADITGRQSHDVVAMGITALNNLEHRGATGAEENTGDGAGILVQVPDAFFRTVTGFALPPVGSYAVGIAFLPGDDAAAVDKAVGQISQLADEEGLEVLGWRDVPVDDTILGPTAKAALPAMRQLFVQAAGQVEGAGDVMTLERLAFCLRKRVQHETGVYFASLSARTVTYKGMLTAPQLGEFYADLHDPSFASALALVHSRFSTNTFPSWPLAHPYRYIAHNGEINTVKGNRNWMRAREALLDSPLIPGDLNRLYPIVDPKGSDSASFDEVLELLHLGGRSLPHAVLMMIPEAWENHTEMAPERKAFYQFHASLMEPWDGPACVTFTDGSVIGAVLDRNGLRPARYWLTDDNLVVLASEVGVLDIEPEPGRPPRSAAARKDVPRRPRAAPGRRRRGGQGRAGRREAVPGVAARRPGPARDAARARARGLQPRVRPAPPADLRLHRGGGADHHVPDGPRRRRADRVDGLRHPRRRALRPGPAALRLLQPAVRPGDQPAARRHPRGAGHLARHGHRRRGQPARAHAGQLPADRAQLPGHRQRRAGQDRPRQRRRRPARLQRASSSAGSTRSPAAGTPSPRPSSGSGRGQRCHRRRRPHRGALRPRVLRRAGADPVAAADQRRAPPPRTGEDPHPGRPDRRDRRRPRGAPHGAAHRLRRGRHQPLPRHRDGRGPAPARARSATSTPPRRPATTSRRSARASSR